MSICKDCLNKKMCYGVGECDDNGVCYCDECLESCNDCNKSISPEYQVETKGMFVELNDMKYDNGKNRLDLIPPEVILELGKILTCGAEKYDDDSWKTLKNFENRYWGALLRHLMAWRMGEEKDSESNHYHLSHAMTNIMFLVWKQLKKEDK